MPPAIGWAGQSLAIRSARCAHLAAKPLDVRWPHMRLHASMTRIFGLIAQKLANQGFIPEIGQFFIWKSIHFPCTFPGKLYIMEMKTNILVFFGLADAEKTGIGP